MLLIVAFYEAYVIVSALEGQIASQVNINQVLEDATLEAIFLGVMVALGYGLVTQGFNGIRRQELLELQDAAEDEVVKTRVMAKIERERVVEKERKGEHRNLVTPKATETTTVTQSADSTSSSSTSSSQGTVIIIPQGTPSAPAEPQPAESAPEPSVSPPPPIYPGYSRDFRVSPITASDKKAEEANPGMDKPVAEPVEVSSSTSDFGNADVMPVASTEQPQALSGVSQQVGVGRAEGPEANTGREVVWEGGPPPALEGVEVLPEPTEKTAESAPAPASPEQGALEESEHGRGIRNGHSEETWQGQTQGFEV